MGGDAKRTRWRALVYEPDGLVCERARQLLRAEGLETCAVDSPELFACARDELGFDVFIVGVRGPGELAALDLAEKPRPLVLLAPLHGADSTHYRVAVGDAVVVDRGLRDPDALRRALGLVPSAERPRPPDDPVRRTFEPFGLSERQLEVLRRALLGETSAAIARTLFISELTVRNHLHAIYSRVGVSGRRELLGRFVRALIPDAERAG